MPVVTLSPELVWGLIPRFVGLIYILAFSALIPQHFAMAGSSRLATMTLFTPIPVPSRRAG